MSKTTTSEHWDRVSADALAGDAGVEAEARRLAVRGRPLASEIVPSRCETQVEEVQNARIGQRNEDLDQEEADLCNLLATIPNSALAVATLDDDVTNRIVGSFQPVTGVIRDTVRADQDATAMHEAFVATHELEENLPGYALSKIRHFALVFALWLLESIASASMYVGASAAGWIGAVLTACAVSALNITLGVLGGIVWRWVSLPNLAHDQGRQRRHRRWAVPAMVVIGVIVIICNFVAANYREVATTAKTFTEDLVLKHIVEHPGELSLTSIILGLLGILCALAAAWKGWSSSVYPGYEKVHRAMSEASAAREDLKQTLQGTLAAIRQNDVEAVWNQHLAADGLLEDLRKRQVALQLRRKKAHELHEDDVEAGSRAIARFRRENLSIREDGITPAYFSQSPHFRAVTKGDGDELARLIEAAQDAHTERTEAVAGVLRQARRKVEIAKSNTERIMLSMGRSDVDAGDVPELGELRELLTQVEQPRIEAPEKHALELESQP